MVIFMAVMLVLYFIGIGVSYAVLRNRQKRETPEGAS
jgi:hypothetical protein